MNTHVMNSSSSVDRRAHEKRTGNERLRISRLAVPALFSGFLLVAVFERDHVPGLGHSRLLTALVADGSLTPKHPVSCQGTWRGEPEQEELHRLVRSGSVEPIDIVVSHCVGSLSWIPTWAGEFHINSAVIYSRCNATPMVTGSLLTSAKVIHIPNRGREGYVWLYHILHLPAETPRDRVTMFLTDTFPRRQDAASCADMYFGAKGQLGFFCGSRPQTSSWSLLNSNSFRHSEHSIWHDSSSLLHAEIKSNYISKTHDYKDFFDSDFDRDPSLTFASWLIQMNVSLWDPITPVCYGGNFATTPRALRKVSTKHAENMLHSLSRGSNIIEGHFFERIVALLFTTAHDSDTLNVIRWMSKSSCQSRCGGRNGILFGCLDLATNSGS